jgi:hypothetical protein
MASSTPNPASLPCSTPMRYYLRQEPGAVMLHAGICAGVSGNRHPYRDLVLSGASNDSGDIGWHHGPCVVCPDVIAALFIGAGRLRGSAENKSRGLGVKASRARYAAVLGGRLGGSGIPGG